MAAMLAAGPDRSRPGHPAQQQRPADRPGDPSPDAQGC